MEWLIIVPLILFICAVVMLMLYPSVTLTFLLLLTGMSMLVMPLFFVSMAPLFAFLFVASGSVLIIYALISLTSTYREFMQFYHPPPPRPQTTTSVRPQIQPLTRSIPLQNSASRFTRPYQRSYKNTSSQRARALVRLSQRSVE